MTDEELFGRDEDFEKAPAPPPGQKAILVLPYNGRGPLPGRYEDDYGVTIIWDPAIGPPQESGQEEAKP